MRYLPKSPVEREQMLAALGVRSLEDLFVSIPAGYRLNRPLRLPGPLSETESTSGRGRRRNARRPALRPAAAVARRGRLAYDFAEGKIEIVNSG